MVVGGELKGSGAEGTREMNWRNWIYTQIFSWKPWK